MMVLMKHSLLFKWRKTTIRISPCFLLVHVTDSYKRHHERVRERIKTKARE